MNLKINDLIKLKKQHPCGSNEWVVIRVGADYKLKCQGCGRVILLSSEQLKKQSCNK